MNLTKNIFFINFNRNKKSNILKKNFYEIIKNKNEVLNSLKPNYNYSYSNNFVKKIKNKLNCRIIGMGGSILGTKAIYKFLKHKLTNSYIRIKYSCIMRLLTLTIYSLQ